ncbi:acyl carrier protein [Desulfocurvibacter africanus PCS]|uniref:Acyl carrier protein n=1 Tax=Desulfocurvibacter africanus PCS TaxID=1262666 RepID=M5PQ76_DESAF|nr:phosphopantetheine-binding protein [Desulfocurvibacter africanus]EMG36194.1 acyl carrier protein [Desulfocurvibacter africanus PCS]
MNAAHALENELQSIIVKACNVQDAPEEVLPEAPLIGPDSPLGLDSLDAVEIVVAVQAHYGVRIDDQNVARRVLASLRVLADFIRSRQ